MQLRCSHCRRYCEVEVEVSVLEVFLFSQLTSLSVFSGCESSVGASL
jgi:hypothetical protein